MPPSGDGPRAPALGFVGLGRMGASMVRRLLRRGHEVAAWDRQEAATAGVARDGGLPASSLADLVGLLVPPRIVWVMLPAGDPTEQTVIELGAQLQAGDTIVDGGNTHYKDDVLRARALAARGIHYVDVGTSGGIRGGERGYCLMIGGPAEAVARLEPIFRALAPGAGGVSPVAGLAPEAATAQDGFFHCGPAGAGHFVKMIHNAIEYGLMQAYAEGFDILRHASSPAGARASLLVRSRRHRRSVAPRKRHQLLAPRSHGGRPG